MPRYDERRARCSRCIVVQLNGSGFVDELEAAILACYREGTGRAMIIENAILTRRALYAIQRRGIFWFPQPRRTNSAIRRHATRRRGHFRRIISNELYEDYGNDGSYGRLRLSG